MTVSKTISYKRAISRLQNADLVVITNKNTGEDSIVTYLNWRDETDEKSDFIFGNSEYDLTIPFNAKITIDENGCISTDDYIITTYKKT
jgi:hypothetical protein